MRRRRFSVAPRRAALMAFAAVPLTSACADNEDPVGPNDDDEAPAVVTVEAVEDWGFVRLGEATQTVSVADPVSSDGWDMGFLATSVMLNGGAAGPAGVVGHCLCQNASASDDALMAMTAESEVADFEGVTEADIPSDEEAWASDALAPAIDGWYSYDFQTHTASAAPENVWKVRTASGDAFAKFHVTAIEDATREHAGRVTFEYAVQPAAGEAFGPTETYTVDLSGGDVHFDLESGAEVDASAAWDLRFDGWDVRVNGGVSGDGSAGASPADQDFAAIADAGDLTAGHYRGDAFGGVFDDHPWYRYNLDGNHQIWPTFDVYLVKRGDAVYKVQLTSYYSATGQARHVSLRSERLR